jgi:pimeloyl-ACP methyl ester carboxylesterase
MIRAVTLFSVLFLISCSVRTDEASHPTASVSFVSMPKTSEKLIVFIHGVFGDPVLTWTNQAGQSWPDLMKLDDNFRDFSLATVRYYTPTIGRASSIEEAATRLLRQLEDNDIFRRYNEIYFIGHSMGGLLAKRILIDLNRPNRVAILRRVKAVLYISTPSQGVNIAETGSWLSLNPQLRDMRPADLNSFLQTLENQWQDLIRDRGAELFPRSFCAYETKPTYGVIVVSRVYSATSCDQNPLAVDEDHSTIVKPSSSSADIYIWARSRIQEASGLTKPQRIPSTAALRLEVSGAKATAKIGDSRIDNYNRADILIIAQDMVTGAGVPSLAPPSTIGNRNSVITLPSGWQLDTILVPPGGCSLWATGLENDGKGGYRLSVMTRGTKESCEWLRGDYHFRLKINVNKFRGSSIGKITVD